MADNVNIIVQDTINDIVVNAAVVVETIDINVQAAVDVVDIVANPNNYVVNINRIIGEQVQSDWTQNDNQAPDYIKNKPSIPTATSDLTNDGEDGINPFITAADVTPQVNSDWDATSGVAEILNKPTIPTNTSDLVNDGEDGVNPFITANDIPPVTGFVPYTGATEDLNLGEYGLLTGNIEFDNTPTNVPTTAGAMYWNDSDGTADLILKGGNVKLQVGQESVIRVVNKTATNINLLEANYQAVRVTGAQGQRLKVDLAQATTDNLSAETIGLVTETINNNQEGFITTSGLVRNINTTGSLQGETWADGDILYLSPTTAGRVTKVKPTAPNHLVIVGYVVHAHANQGSIFVKVDNGYELDELHNVKITSAANNNVLAYTSATDIWENKTVETALGYTPQQQLISGTNIKTINGASVLGSGDLVVGGSTSLAIGTTPITSGTIGRVLFQGTGDVLQQNGNLFWDNTNNRLGVGTNAPTDILDIRKNQFTTNVATTTSVLLTNSNNNGIAAYVFTSDGTTRQGGLQYNNTIGQKNLFSCTYTDIPYYFGTNNLIRLTLTATTGNVLINTTTDAGFRLDVNGTARVSGNTKIGTNAYNDPASNLIVGLVSGTNAARLAVANASNYQDVMFVNTSISSGNINTWSFGQRQDTFFGNALGSFQIVGAHITNAGTISTVGGGYRVPLICNPDGTIILSGATNSINGNVLIGSNTNVASGALQIDSTTKGFLPPRMTSTQKNAIATPAAGLVVYDTTLGKLCVRGAAAWETITSI